MPNYTQRAVANFVRGLITEAGELSFPENASIDELNCNLFRDGTRRRRRGIQYEEDNVFSTFTVAETTRLSFGEWTHVANDAGKDYLVVQVGDRLHFYNKNVFPFSSAELPNSVNLAPFAVAGTGGAALNRCEFASVLGVLVVVSAGTNPVYIEENSNGTFTARLINCRVRDFKWLGDRSTYSASGGSNPPVGRRYDTQNAGWADGPNNVGTNALTTYRNARSNAWPPLTHPWYSGKDSNDVFSVTEWEKIYAGSSILGNGHYILNLFSKNRSAASGIGGIPTENEPTRFTTVAAFAGRVFFSGLSSAANAGRVFFSQILQDLSSMGEFLQQNDPTSEEISDLLETDGGEIVIPEANLIRKLYAFRNSIFVFADNGVWQITGVDDIFSPSAYSVNRISEIGLLAAGSFTSAEGVPFWWSRFGVHTLSFDEFGRASEQNLSISTIQSFWDDISPPAKLTVEATYDKVNKKIFWVYKNDLEPINNKYNNVLILDVALQAFYPWRFEDRSVATPYVVGLQFYRGFGNSELTFDVVSNNNDVVSNTNAVISTQQISEESNNVSVIFFVRDQTLNKLTMATVTNRSFVDWGQANFTSYAETGFDFIGDLALKKTAPYVVIYLRETETGWLGNEIAGYTPANESSLWVTTYWDFNSSPSSQPQQAYRRKLPVFVNPNNLSNYESPGTVITSRLKCRGRGRSMRMRIESEEGKDFIYIGHGVIADVAARF